MSDDGAVVELDQTQGRAFVDEASHRYLGMSVDEFIRRYDAGELDREDQNVMQVAVLLPFAR